jgi:sugar transferase (PEP-CTERM/EpsH1 system associated)
MEVVLSMSMGGLENMVINLLRSMDREIYDPVICTFSPHGELEDEAEKMSVPVYRELKKVEAWDRSLAFRMRSLCRKLNIDIVHTHNFLPYFYAGIGAKLAGTPGLVHTVHSNIRKKQPHLIRAERWLSRFTDRIVSDSEKVNHELVHRDDISQDKIDIILNGIDTNRFRPDIKGDKIRAELDIPAEAPIIGTVARLARVKDIPTLLQAFQYLHVDAPKAHLVIVGDGPDRGDLEKAAGELGIAGFTHFLGNRNDTYELLPSIDVFVLPSLSEGLSLTILEALSSERPVIATDVGGNPEIIVDGENGLLIPVGKPEILAEKITDFLLNKAFAISCGRAGREKVKRIFSLQVMVDRYEDVFADVLTRKGWRGLI